MFVQHPLQHESCLSKAFQMPEDITRGPVQVISRWLKTAEAATYARFGSADGFSDWAQAEGIPSIRRGRVRLWDRMDIDARLESGKSYGASVHVSSNVGRRRG